MLNYILNGVLNSVLSLVCNPNIFRFSKFAMNDVNPYFSDFCASCFKLRTKHEVSVNFSLRTNNILLLKIRTKNIGYYKRLTLLVQISFFMFSIMFKSFY